MATTSAVATDVLTDVVRERARAEAREVVAMLDYRDAELERIAASDESPMRRHVERGSVALTIGEASGMSEGQVQYRLSVADTVRDQSPTTWDAFLDGRVDLARVREIGSAIDQLKRADSVHRLDKRVVGYAETHTVAELRTWLKAFVRRVEADLAVERAEDERTKRYVSVKRGDDSMGWLSAYLPSHELAAIEDRYRKAARRITDPDDKRTLAQREADLLVAWCTESDASTSAIDANIAVTVGADVLAGFTPGFAESADGRWGVPPRGSLRSSAPAAPSGTASWSTPSMTTTSWLTNTRAPRLNHGPSGARQVPGRSPAATESLVRRGTSRAPHRVPFPEGQTTGDNLGPLCRRHHGYKGHGLLHWTTRAQPRG